MKKTQHPKQFLLSSNEAFYNTNLSCFFCLKVVLFYLVACLSVCFSCYFNFVLFIDRKVVLLVNFPYLGNIILSVSRFRLRQDFFLEHVRFDYRGSSQSTQPCFISFSFPFYFPLTTRKIKINK